MLGNLFTQLKKDEKPEETNPPVTASSGVPSSSLDNPSSTMPPLTVTTVATAGDQHPPVPKPIINSATTPQILSRPLFGKAKEKKHIRKEMITDLTQEARENNLDVVIGREAELRTLITFLLQRNN